MGVGDEEEEDEGENLFGDDMENDYRQGDTLQRFQEKNRRFEKNRLFFDLYSFLYSAKY